jgi:hypothetical protein
LSFSRLHIKGNGDASAVVCTKDKTYSIRIAETSNTLLLAKPSQKEDACDITGIASFQYEVGKHLNERSPCQQVLRTKLLVGWVNKLLFMFAAWRAART